MMLSSSYFFVFFYCILVQTTMAYFKHRC
jgi:hypothetical protein